MMKAIPKHWFSWDYTILENDVNVAHLDLSVWREKGTLTVNGEDYDVYREGLLSGKFILEQQGTPLATAIKASAFRQSSTITFADDEYELKPKSMFTRGFVLLQGSHQVGSVSPTNMLMRKAAVDLPAHLPLAVRVFIVWLAVILWKRQSEAGSS
jgi:hypothetical protein